MQIVQNTIDYHFQLSLVMFKDLIEMLIYLNAVKLWGFFF